MPASAHDDAEEADSASPERFAACGCRTAAKSRCTPGRRSQPARTLDRARPRWSYSRSPRCAVPLVRGVRDTLGVNGRKQARIKYAPSPNSTSQLTAFKIGRQGTFQGRITASSKTLRPDAKYNSLLVSKFVNCLMLQRQEERCPQRLLRRHGRNPKEAAGSRHAGGLHPSGGERKAVHRSAFPSRRRRRLPSADASRQEPSALAGDSLDAASRSRKEGPSDRVEAGRRILAAYNREGAAVTKR